MRPTPERLAVLAAAVDLAQRHDLHLIGIGGAAPYFPPNGSVSGEMVQTIAEDQDEAFAAAEEAFHAAAASLGRKARFRIVRAGAVAALIAEAAAADLIIAPLERSERLGALDIGALVLGAGAPVLAASPGVERLSLKAVLLAWRDTLEARRAVTAAIPLLGHAEAAAVVQVVETQVEVQAGWEGLNGVLGRLSRHGVVAEGEVRVGRSASRALLEEADERGSDLLLLGAYGHSRARERILGGVTRELLETTAKPLLLVH